MKKRYLKKWVQVVLAMILLASIVILGSDSVEYFITSKIISLGTLLSSGYILFKYSKIEE